MPVQEPPHPHRFLAADTYRGRVLRVVDGDTVRVRLDVGFEVCTVVDVRLAGINAPELHGDAAARGREAKAVVEQLLPAGLPVLLVSSQRRSFARYVGQLMALTEGAGAWRDVAPWLLELRSDLFAVAHA